MKAVVIERQGDVDGLVYRDWPDPTPADDQVVLDVKAVGLNHLDIFVRRGMPGYPVQTPFISGGDIAGTIAACGRAVTGWAVGDRVAVNPLTPQGMMGEAIPGGMCEQVAVPASHVIGLPDGLSFVEAACIPINYGTARRMLRAIGDLQAGELVLNLGASGGVGIAVLQIAKLIGATVIAVTSSAEKAAFLTELGADHVINTQAQEFSAEAWRISGRQGVDMVINHVGGDSWVPSLRCLRKRGRLVTCGATAGFDPRTDIRYIWVRELQILGSDGYSHDDIATALGWAGAGRLQPRLHAVLPFSAAATAHTLLESRQVSGKIVLVPEGEPCVGGGP